MSKELQLDPFSKVMRDLKSGGGPPVELKRQNEHGVLETVGEAEMKALGTKARVASTAQLLHKLTPEEKLEWAMESKEEANQLYRNEQYLEAMEKYVEVLTATDFGSEGSHTTNDNRPPPDATTDAAVATKTMGNVDELVIPVLCNLSACCMKLQQWNKSIMFCDQALRLRPKCGKALLRRGKSLLSVGEFLEAKDNFLTILEMESSNEHGLSDQDLSSVHGLIEKAKASLRREKAGQDMMKKSLQRAFQFSSSTSPASNTTTTTTIITDTGREVTVVQMDASLPGSGSSVSEDTVAESGGSGNRAVEERKNAKALKPKPEPMSFTEFIIFLLEVAFKFFFGFLLATPSKNGSSRRKSSAASKEETNQ